MWQVKKDDLVLGYYPDAEAALKAADNFAKSDVDDLYEIRYLPDAVVVLDCNRIKTVYEIF